MKPPVKFFSFILGITCLLSLIFLIYPWSLSPQTRSFSLSLDLDNSVGDQAASSLDASPNQVISIQIFGKDIQNANGFSTLFEYDATQVVYEKFDVGDILPNPLVEQDSITVLQHNVTSVIQIDMTSLDEATTANSSLIGTLRFRTTDAFSNTEIRLIRAGLDREGQFEIVNTATSIALGIASPSLDFDGSGIVDFPDFLMFVSAFGSEEGQDKYDSKYDLNSDGKIAFEDLLILTDNFGESVVAQKSPTPPTPPTSPGQGNARPDLIVESPKVSDSNPEAEAYFTLSVTVRNQGTGTSPILMRLSYYQSTDETISTSDTEVGWDLVSRLDPSETGEESDRVRAPSSGGTYYYGACIEVVSGESDTGNNCSSAVAVTVLGSDLIVESPSVDNNTPGPGESFYLSATVRNQGGGRSSSTTLRYYLSTDETITTSDTEVGTDYVSRLDASESSEESVRLSAPSSEGTYYYGACVEATSGESDTGNNCSSAIAVTVIGPDLIVEPPSVSDSSPDAGAYFTLSATVRNQGGSRSDFTTLRYYLSTDETISTSDTEVTTDFVSRLDPSETSDESARIRAPSSAGTYYYGACVESVTGESDTGNNCSTAVTVTVGGTSPPPPPPPTPTPSGSPGRPDAPTVTASTLNSLSVRWSAPTNTGSAISDYDVQYREAGGSFTDWPHTGTSTTTTITGLTANTRYEVQVRARNAQGESNWSPSGSGTTSSSGGSGNNPDLIVETPTVSDSSPIAGSYFKMRTLVRNQGGGRSASTTLRYYLSTDETITTDDTEIGTDYLSRFYTTNHESVTLQAPSSEGTYYYGACVDAVTGESDTGNNCSSAVTVTVLSSDLVVETPTVSESSPKAGAYFTLSATVRNLGGGAAHSTILRYYLSTDETITTSDTEVGTDYLSGVSAYGTNHESAYLRAPSSDGTYYYGACVEAVTGESDTGNNCSSAVTVTVGGTSPPPPPPPTPTPSGSPGRPDAPVVTSSTLNSLSLRWTAPTNTGSAISDYDIQYRATGGSFTDWPHTGTSTTTTITGLTANIRYEVQVRARNAQGVGNWSPSGSGTTSSSGGSGGSGNNPDLIVESPAVSDSSPDAGAYFTLSATVRNQGGSRSASTTLRYYLSTDETITTSDTEVESDYVTRLDPSAISDESARIEAPSSEGTYYYGACVEPVDGESDTGNNCSSAITVTVLGSDLVVEPPSVSNSSPGPGASFTLSATVRNQGGGAAPSTTLRYYLSTDETITTGDQEIETSYVSSLDPSETSDERAYLNAPSSEGTYYYGACVESVTGESDTGNNCSSAVTVTVSGSDLIVESPTVDNNTPGPGESFYLSATVRNQGGSRSNYTTLRYYLSTDETITTSDTEVDTDYVSYLDPSETSEESARLTAPSSEGTYYYGACVEAVTGESDTGNNCSSAVTVTVSGSDLIVESPTVSESSPKAGASFRLYATVRNQGGSRSASTTLRYYLSTDVTINTNDQEVDTDYVSRLAPSETSEEYAFLRAPSSDGTYYYGACVEAVTGESDTGNNCSSAVTMTVGSTTPPPPPTPNQPPVFSEGTSTTRSMAENTGAGQNIGNPVSATDGDSDRLTYSLEGRDASAFTIISGSGQLRTRSGVTYDYETQNSYSVTVRTQDNKGGSATIAVTITLTDENETPGRPDAPTITASTLNSLSLRWTAPTNSGSAISDYDVQYREAGGSFTDWPHTGTSTTTTITGLTANTDYEVQVRARNAQGVSNWSPSATGTTTANQSPVFSEGTNTTRSIAENTGAGQNIGNPVSATDGDNDQLTYSLQGRDASAFTVQSSSGQLRTRSGVTYDYETKDTYSVTVRAQDGKGGSATIAVEITLTDENEPPGRPDAPTVTASSNSLSLRWTAPTNLGPAISDYDIQYRTTGGNFTDWPHTGTSTTTAITGLTENTGYEVQVRATNDEGTGDWSPSGSGTTSSTGANNPDLIVESPSVDNNPLSPEQYFRLSATVRNQGGERSSSTTLRYYLSTDETISTSDTEVGTDYVFRLDASETSNESVRLKAPSSEGTYYYGACVESISGESDTGNNCSSAVTVTVSGPDLIVESPSINNNTPTPGRLIRLSTTVRNQGDGRAPSTTLRYYQSTDETIDQSDTEIDTDYVSSLDPSETSDEWDSFSAPSSAGTYYYGACVEAVTGESDTGNNCSSAVTVTVRGAPPPPAPNQPPVFSEGTSTTRSIAENTGAGQNVGNPVSATDSDGDRLTYSLQGRDASDFTIISGSGQLRTRSGETYDYETKDSYLVTVRVQDGEGGSATISVTITLTDENEPPDRPDAPVVTASTLNSLSLRWTVPTNPGPAISDYDVQYREAGGSFTDWPHTGTGTTTTITGLTANTRYEVQVRARNAQGESSWSLSVTGTTIANQSPVFSEGTSTTRSIAENTGTGQNIGNPVSATDGDNDQLTYSLEGRDASTFTVQQNSGQLMTRSDETYDYETKDSYSVTVRAQDDKGGSATISVEITLTDENEPPGRPAAPTVMASSNTLSVRWTAPENTGPAISGYDVQYRESGGSFTDWPHIGPSLSTTIRGLMSETPYEVQVRATNDEGTSDWSPSGNGTTSRPAPGFAPVDQNAFNTFVTDKVLSVETYYIEFVSTGRFEENNQYPGSYTYSNTGSNTGILTQNYDGGQLGGTCTIEMTFSSTTKGTLRAKCGSDANYDSPQQWRLSNAPDPNAFNIEIIWIGSEPSEYHRAAFNAAVTRWENIITSDIPDVFVSSDEGGEIDGVKVFGLVDDLQIYASLTNIDGPGETLGSAGPREMRGQSKLPIVARMRFDTSDLGDFTLETLQDLYLHEMGHCLGIGTLWKRLGLLRNPSIDYIFFIIPVEVDDADTHFAGAEAIAAFNDAGGTNYIDGKVPVENEKGGPGTKDGHWRQSVFGPNELMEGFLSPSSTMRGPLSAITIQSLSDLGYIVNVGQADPYTLPSPAAAKLAIASEHLVPINCLLIEPIGEIDEYKPIELKPKRLKKREDQ